MWTSQRPAVGSSDWLGLCAWLINQIIVVWTFAVKCLPSADGTSLHVASEDVQLAFRNAAIVARLSICSPVLLLNAIANSLIFFAANPKGLLDRIFAHGGFRPNEREISHGGVPWQTR